MEHSLLISSIRRRVEELERNPDKDQRQILVAPATLEAIQTAEESLGFSLYPLHKELLTTVSNGGFGPGFGLLGVSGGYSDDEGRTIVDLRNVLWIDETTFLPVPVVPVCDLGGGMWLCLDSKDGRALTISEHGLLDIDVTFDDVMKEWADGKGLGDRTTFFEERSVEHLKTKQPVLIRVPFGAKGKPYRSSTS